MVAMLETVSTFQVRSEVGTVRRVMLHRPDLELRRLTPTNAESLLFDDVLWVKRARQEHDAFADALRERGVDVLLFGDLLAETLADPAARQPRPRDRGTPALTPMRSQILALFGFETRAEPAAAVG